MRIEHALQMLEPPRWPEHILGAIDRDKAARGKELFEQRCRGCHGPHVAEPARAQASAPLKPEGQEWRIEVIPLEHIGTDPTAAQGFMERRYDIAETGLTNAELQATLRPLLTRALARDLRFRLREVVRLRAERGAPDAGLGALLATHPDPDASAQPSLDAAALKAIDDALVAGVSPLPEVPDAAHRPDDPLKCDENCHLLNLLWDIRQGAAGNEAFLATLDVTKLSEGLALNIVGILIKNRYYADYGIDYATQQCLEGFGALDLPQEIAGYKPRPLAGVWATAPFLHNGSVPTLYQMLLPPDKRDTRFFVGRREYDPRHVGYVTAPDADGDDDGFWLDTSLKGNHNTGHAFAADAATWKKFLADRKNNPLPSGVIGPEFSDDERFALIEYLKVHEDPETPADFRPPVCKLWGRDL
jgi:mono/diheme cytochrome c family protein